MNHLKTGNAFFGAGSFKNYKFLGQELQETGFYDMNARFYMADLGRFGMHDPLSASTLDPYGYGYNNPILFADPSGLEGDPVNGGGGPGGPVTPASFGDIPGGYNGAPTLMVGAGANDVAAEQGIQGITLTGQKSAMSKILTHPSIHSLTYGLGLTNEMPKDAVTYNPNPINVGCGHCNDHGVIMMDSMWDVAGIVIANNISPENQDSFLALSALAIILSRGSATDEVLKAEAGILKAEAQLAESEVNIVAKRGSFRKGTLKNAWDKAEDGTNINTKKCPTCSKDVEGNPYLNEKRGGADGWDASHNPSWSNRNHSGMTRKQQLDNYNSGVDLECFSCNRAGKNNDSRFKK